MLQKQRYDYKRTYKTFLGLNYIQDEVNEASKKTTSADALSEVVLTYLKAHDF